MISLKVIKNLHNMLKLCIRGIKIRLRSAILLIIVASLYCFYQIWLEQILVNYNTIKYKDEGRGVGKIHSRQSRYKEDKIRSTLSFLMNLKSRSIFYLLCFVNSWKNRSLICLLYSYFAYFVPTLPTMHFTHTRVMTSVQVPFFFVFRSTYAM